MTFELQNRKVSLETRRELVFNLIQDGEWHTTSEINEVGGSDGMRRLRELREEGLQIEKKKFWGSDQYMYRVVK